MADEYATRSELNGLGARLNTQETSAAVQDVEIKNLQREAAEQKRDVWQSIGEMRNEGRGLIVKVSFIMGGISFAGVLLSVVVQIIFKGG